MHAFYFNTCINGIRMYYFYFFIQRIIIEIKLKLFNLKIKIKISDTKMSTQQSKCNCIFVKVISVEPDCETLNNSFRHIDVKCIQNLKKNHVK